MSYVKLQVRSGGLVIKTDKYNKLNMKTSKGPDNKEVIQLITPTSIKGIISFLMGEKRKIYPSLNVKLSNNNFEKRQNEPNVLFHSELIESVYKKIKLG